METNEKLMMLLRLMDKPEAMAEAQLQELLADEEVREAYELMVDCKKVYQMKTLRAITPLQHGRNAQRTGWVFYRKIAAIFLAAVFLGGLSFAAYRALSHRQTQTPQVSAPSQQGRAEGESGGGGLLLFADVRLDSMLAIVSQHYGKAVFFGDEELKALRIHTKWNREDSLAAFIENLNELDGLSLTEQRDTIFVQKGGAQ